MSRLNTRKARVARDPNQNHPKDQESDRCLLLQDMLRQPKSPRTRRTRVRKDIAEIEVLPLPVAVTVLDRIQDTVVRAQIPDARVGRVEEKDTTEADLLDETVEEEADPEKEDQHRQTSGKVEESQGNHTVLWVNIIMPFIFFVFQFVVIHLTLHLLIDTLSIKSNTLDYIDEQCEKKTHSLLEEIICVDVVIDIIYLFIFMVRLR